MFTVRHALPWPPNKVNLQIICQPGCKNLIDFHAFFQRSHDGTVAWVVELTYLHLVVECESLLCGHGKARCTVKEHTLNLTVSGEVESEGFLKTNSESWYLLQSGRFTTWTKCMLNIEIRCFLS